MVLPEDSSITPRTYSGELLGDDFGVVHPHERFREWFQNAAVNNVLEPDACTLSSCEQGHPNARTIALRGITDSSLLIYTNYRSTKSREIESNSDVALTFYWREVFRQVRIRGIARKTSSEQSDQYFATRPRGSQVAAWVSHQSQPLGSRQELNESYEQYDRELGEMIERPPFWGGFEIEPFEYEFFQGQPSRLHERFLFTRNASGRFSAQRLWP